MKIDPFYEPDTGTWTYLLCDHDGGDAAIIDPVWVYDPVSGAVSRDFIDPVLALARSRNCTIRWVLETHAHADHLSAAALIRRETGARIGASRGIRAVQQTFAKVFNLADLDTDGRQFDRLFGEGDRLQLGALTIEVLETPGHTNDSITYRVGDAAFVGDTLFAPGYGSARCDFPGGDAGLLFDSIRKLHALPADTRLFLCHDYPQEGAAPRHCVSVAESRRDNIHVNTETDRAKFIAMREARDATLALPRLILPSIQVNIRAGEPPPAERNGAHYLKIPFDTSIEALLGADDD